MRRRRIETGNRALELCFAFAGFSGRGSLAHASLGTGTVARVVAEILAIARAAVAASAAATAPPSPPFAVTVRLSRRLRVRGTVA